MKVVTKLFFSLSRKIILKHKSLILAKIRGLIKMGKMCKKVRRRWNVGEISSIQKNTKKHLKRERYYIKTQQKIMSDFAGKKVPPPPRPLFFLRKNFFFGFSEKFLKFIFNEVDCKKFANFFFAMNSAVKHFSIA